MEYRRLVDTRFKQDIELAVCANDIVHWFNHWAWTDDPREEHSLRPFDLFPKQAEFLLWLKAREEAREGGIAEKSRDVGFTWMCIGYALYGWLFRDGYKVGFGSRKLDLVDQIGNPDTILDKGRILLRNLPAWMLPKGYSERQHAGYCKIVNPVNGSNITGEGGDQIGRGGRKSIYFVDESAFLEHPSLIERSLSATTDVRIDVSTPNGPGNPFATKRLSNKVKVFTFHWKDDPRKSEEWAEKKRAEIDPVAWAQEYDIDYTASIEGICIPAQWVRAAVDLVLPPVSDSYPLSAGFDVADSGKNENVLIERRGPYVGEPASWAQMNTTQSAWKAAEIAVRRGIQVVNFDPVGVGAGVRGTWESSEHPLGFRAVPINVGQQPTLAKWPSGKTSRETFVNLRAELWWRLRTRFEKTFEYVTQGVEHPADEMISIPNCPKLIAQLSMPLCSTTDTGKIKIESKDDMKKRGVSSPDHGDALALSEMPCFTPLQSQRGGVGGWL